MRRTSSSESRFQVWVLISLSSWNALEFHELIRENQKFLADNSHNLLWVIGVVYVKEACVDIGKANCDYVYDLNHILFSILFISLFSTKKILACVLFSVWFQQHFGL